MKTDRMWSDADAVNATKIVIDISSAFAYIYIFCM